MESSKGPPQPAQQPKATPPPPPPHSGEGADSALEALKRVTRTRPAARERAPDARSRRK